MRMVLIGHRGVGKSHLLDRLKVYYQDQTDLKFFDLDREIESRQGKSVSTIFSDEGEKKFRELEISVFREISDSNPNVIVSLGAGFHLQHISSDFTCVWVRRATDVLGRIFLNRPRLDPDVSPLDEYLQRMPLRDEHYKKHATVQYLMPEGLEESNSVEQKIFTSDLKSLGGILTLLPEHFENLDFLQKLFRNFDVDCFELRDDLLSIRHFQIATSLLPASRVLISLREKATLGWIVEYLRTGVRWDWALELGPCPYGQPTIYSIHQIADYYLEDLEALNQYLERFRIPSICQVKLSPKVENFDQLRTLWSWQKQNPQFFSILPRSEQGIWKWFRLLLKGRQKINFFRLDQGSAQDQPSLYEWLATANEPNGFAAVLGHPVGHSRTPIEHQSYFEKSNRAVFAIQIPEEEFFDAMSFLDELGLSHAAVTSPLKLKTFQWINEATETAERFESVNTIFKTKNDSGDYHWIGENTDVIGFQKQYSEALQSQNLKDLKAAIWGGGGTLPIILSVIPDAYCFSARFGKLKMEYGDQKNWSEQEMTQIQIEGPEALIWAGSPESQMPPESWKPKVVVDLNYREDSRAREYALEVKAQYIDGLTMFKEQARAQRQFWDRGN